MRRIVKLSAGVCLLAFSGYVALTEGFSIKSHEAVINARISVVRAPIDGTLALQPNRIGEVVEAGSPLGMLINERADDARVLELERSAANLKAELGRLHTKAQNLQDQQQMLNTQSEAYKQGRIQQLEAREKETRAALESAKAQAKESKAELGRATELQAKGIQASATVDKAVSAQRTHQMNVEAAARRVDAVSIELEAARTGTFLGDSYNDLPFSSQRAQDIALALADVNADIAQREQLLQTASGQVAMERQRLNRMRAAALASPVEGWIWETPAGSGEYARQGQDVIRLVDCSTVIVTASVSERDYNRLQAGETARFRPSGSRRVFEGQVLRLAGAGAASVYEHLAITPGDEHLEQFDVALSFPELSKDTELSCAVGRTGKIVFGDAPFVS